MTGLRSVSVLTLPNHFHSLWCSTDFVLHGWLTGAIVKELQKRGEKMTHYYYLASDRKMGLGNGSIDYLETNEIIPGFDYPVQLEIMNGLEKEWELRELLQYIRNHTAPFKVCTVQIANLINSNKVELKVREESKILFHEILNPKQLLLEEGHLLTIKKVPYFN